MIDTEMYAALAEEFGDEWRELNASQRYFTAMDFAMVVTAPNFWGFEPGTIRELARQFKRKLGRDSLTAYAERIWF